MFALNLYCILALIIFPTKTVQLYNQECDSNDRINTFFCKAFDNIFKADNGKFSKYACGCAASPVVADPSVCHADEYDFPDAPECGKLFKSNQFKIECSTPSSFTLFIQGILNKIGLLCDKTFEALFIKAIESMFNVKPVVASIEFVIATGNFSYIPCYREFQNLSSKPKFGIF